MYISADYSIQSVLSNQCEMVFYNATSSATVVDITLPDEPLCGTVPVTGSNPMSSKYFRIQNVDDADDLKLHPGSGDRIYSNGTGCTSSPYTLTCGSNPTTVDVYGWDSGSGHFWVVMPIVGTCTCD